jgi:hypothetical protein
MAGSFSLAYNNSYDGGQPAPVINTKSPLYIIYIASPESNYVQTAPNPLFRLSSKRVFHYGESINAIDRLN